MSNEPQPRVVQFRPEFFEVRTDGHEVSVERCRQGEAGRENLPFTMTREQLGRLVDGIGKVMGKGTER